MQCPSVAQALSASGLSSLVPAPLYTGMREGKVVRFEEITRCPVEIQDTLLAVLSDRLMLVPELKGEGRTLFAAPGFYHGADTVQDLVDFVVSRCLDQLGVDNALVRRWGE